MWIYRAYDEYDLPVAEAYTRERLIQKLLDEFGHADFTIKRLFEKALI